jgi:uncharacterized protein YbgA (DUF1722 family)/uncharacterized protein YbbK (DUF523 family)
LSSEKEKIRVGVSSCLLGEQVRWNGEHKKDVFVYEVLGRYFEWAPSCPEMEIGMGVPREAVYLEGKANAAKLIGKETKTDWTAKMVKYSRQRSRELGRAGICGYIFKENSPTCGVQGVKLFSESGNPAGQGSGLFAHTFMERCPLVPVEEEGRLHDPKIRENFIVRVFSYHRLLRLFEKKYSRSALVQFHTNQKFLLLAHSRKHYDRLGRLVANDKKVPPAKLVGQYTELFMQTLSVKTTVKKNVDVLHHLLGFLKEILSKEEKQDILETIQDYHNQWVPLVVPLTLLRHHVRTHNIEYLMNQVYLNPHPKELMLRNHV